MKQFFIDILAFTTLFSSLLVITSKNPVISVVFLISVFLNAAGYLILTGINFLGISYIIIYIGAIVVLFLFVIMLLNIDFEDLQVTGSQYSKNLPLAGIISFMFIYEFVNILPFTINDVSIINNILYFFTNLNSTLFISSANFSTVYKTVNPSLADTSFVNFTQIEAIGHYLYTYGSIWLIICSIILLLSMIAPIFLHSKQTNKPQPTNIQKSKSTYNLRRKINNNKTRKFSTLITSYNLQDHQENYEVGPIKPTEEINKNAKTLDPLYITGFTDAEGHFGLRLTARQDRRTGWMILVRFVIHLHLKDINLLKEIQSYFGVGKIYIANKDNSVTYSVDSLTDLIEKIIPHFDRYPLISQKRADYILFKSAIKIIASKDHLNHKGLEKILSIKSSLNRGLSSKLIKLYPNIIPVSRPLVSKQKEIDCNWLSGFTEGEGCFLISKFKKDNDKLGFGLNFNIVQHKRDIELLEQISITLNCGKVYLAKNRDQAEFKVQNFTDIYTKVIPFFKNYSLSGDKLFNFKDFCLAAELIKNKEHLTEKGIIKLLDLKKGMNNGRKG